MMSNEEIVRIECLKLAVGEDAIDAAAVVDRARAYAEFVLGKQDGRDG
jgi:hypothetical protein